MMVTSEKVVSADDVHSAMLYELRSQDNEIVLFRSLASWVIARGNLRLEEGLLAC